MCVMCVLCVGFFKLFTAFLKRHVFFSKKNFQSKQLYTHYTHRYSPHVYWVFALSNCTHICTHTVHTWPSSVHTCHFRGSYVHEPRAYVH